jgi:hypothetical protein
MTEHNQKLPPKGDAEQAPAHTEPRIDPWDYEAEEIEGWALQWDTTALRKASLARTMRHLQQSSVKE